MGSMSLGLARDIDRSSNDLRQVLKPTLGEELFLDIRDLHRSTGYFVYDPGFTCTGSCMSAITFIDGPKALHVDGAPSGSLDLLLLSFLLSQGVCLYRGYPVPDLLQVKSSSHSTLCQRRERERERVRETIALTLTLTFICFCA